MRPGHLQVFSLLCALIGLASGKTCSEDKVFYWTKCYNDVKGPITVNSVKAYQNGKPVETNGGVDLNKPLTLQCDVTNKYSKKEISNPLYDFTMYENTDDDGGPCSYWELEAGELLHNVDACKMISDDCHCKGRPKTMTIVMDLKKETGGMDVSQFIVPGHWYKIEMTLKDGSSPLSCVAIVAKLKG